MAKLFGLSSQEIQVLDRARQILLRSIDQITSQLCSRLTLPPGAADVLGGNAWASQRIMSLPVDQGLPSQVAHKRHDIYTVSSGLLRKVMM